MRGNRIHTRASRRIRSDHRDAALEEFDHRILRDGVYEDVIQDGQLAHLEGAIADLEDVRDRRRAELADTDEDYAAEVARSIEHLQGTACRRVEEICAERCRSVLVDGDEWVEEDWEERDDVDAAKREAANWLLEHREACERLWGATDPEDVRASVLDAVGGADDA